MSFTLIDFFNGFQTLKQSKKFSAGAQSTYYAILAEFNLAHYPATLSISTRDLQQLAGLKSVSATHECRNVLKNNKLIDFKTQRDTTIYRLLTEHLPNAKTVSAEREPNGNRTPDGLFAIPHAGDTAAESFPQTPFKDGDLDDEKAGDDAHARGESGGNGAETVAQANPLSSPIPDANDIQEEWAQAIGYDLRGNYALELERLASLDYGRALRAIQRLAIAQKRNPIDRPFDYFKAVYDGLTPTALKGCDKREQQQEREYDLPPDENDGKEHPWDKY